MGIFKDLFETDYDVKERTEDDDTKLRLRKEELDINKSRIQKGEVELGKEIIEERKSVDVPVTREEVVIERRDLNDEVTDSPITDEEKIRIPVSEEKIDVDKHTVLTGEVTAHKREIEDTEHVDETLKHEEARVNKIGDPNVVDDSHF